MSLICFLISLVLMMMGANSLATLLLFAPNMEYMVWHIVCVVVTIPLAFFFMSKGITQLEKKIYQMKSSFVVENNFIEDNSIKLRHERFPKRNPKMLISVTVNSVEYIADDFDEVLISSFHVGYVLNNIPRLKVLVIRDNHTGKWESYSKMEID